jgi:MFS family permease
VTRFRRNPRAPRPRGSRIGRTVARGVVRPGRAAVSRLPSPVTGALSIGARARLMLALAGVLLAAVDLFTVSLALPDIAAGVGVSPGDMHHAAPILTAFLVGFVTTLPLAGRLAELWGIRRVMLLSLGVYAAGSLCAASADTVAPFLTGRVLQGLAGGALVPTTLAMVDAWWPPELRGFPRRLVVAAQDAAIVAGPLLGAVVLAAATWRALFWMDFLMAGVIGWALVANDDPRERVRRLRLDRVGAELTWLVGLVVALVLLTPDVWADSAVLGWAYRPIVGTTVFTSPLAVTAVLAVVALVLRDLRVPGGVRPVLGLRRVAGLTARVDLLGAGALGLTVGLTVAAMATGSPDRSTVGGAMPYLLAAAVVVGAGTVWRARRASHPVIPTAMLRAPSTRAALVASGLLGAVLVAVLVYVPLFSDATLDHYSRTGAALLLLRLLILVPIGTVAGGWLLLPFNPRIVTAAGSLIAAGGLVVMSQWGVGALRGAGCTFALAAVGLGLGLTVRPVNAVLHDTVPSPAACASLAMTARVAGMAIGLGALTAAGLVTYYSRMSAVFTPDELCPTAPAQCVEYEHAVRGAALAQIQTVFAGAAVLVALTGVLAVVLFRARRVDAPTTGDA